MTPQRLAWCLEQLLWTTDTLAEALGCDESLTEAWMLGFEEVPPKAAAWLETLAVSHVAAEEGKPISLKGKRYTGLMQ